MPGQFRYDLKTQVRDQITGYTGTIVARVQYLYELPAYEVVARSVDGKQGASHWITEPRLEPVDEA